MGPRSRRTPHLHLVYEIRVGGHLDTSWTSHFAGMAITRAPNGETHLRGRLTDQAALYGVLRTIRDTGLELLAVNRVESSDVDDQA